MMDKFNNNYRIESNRAQFIDYSRPDSYFITICIEKQNCILGKIKNDVMEFSEYGKIVANEIIKMPTYHKRVIIDEWIIMPNHIHLLITLGDYDFDNGISLVGDGAVQKIHEFSVHQDEKIHEFSLQQMQQQYRQHRRKMIIPKILGKLQQQSSKQINIIEIHQG